ncbi:MAG: LCP family protein, partial [Defluviitaleaceae bacterium]|nr:LCP family protein [Defluviitaleaceae bacterium]
MSNINLRYIKKFFVISGSITGIYLVLAAAVTLTIIASESNLIRNLRPQQNQSSEGGQSEGETSGDNGGDQIAKQETEDDESFLKPPPRTNFLIIALDQERVLTDALMVGCFYRDTQEIHLMSIPRDLYTQLPDHRLKEMQNEGRHPPSYMKINALRSYGGRLNGIRYLSEQLGEMLGVKFSYYVEVSLPAFKKTVDAIGGVWMEIPNVTGDGIYYYDEFQDLLIDLKAGMQELDGNKAEQLVRFRSYPSGDVGRNAVQMEFMKQLFRQALKREAIMNDPLALYNVIRSEVETDMGVEILSYIPYFSRFTGDKIFTHSMPGVGDYGDDGLSYFFPDGKAMPGV